MDETSDSDNDSDSASDDAIVSSPTNSDPDPDPDSDSHLDQPPLIPLSTSPTYHAHSSHSGGPHHYYPYPSTLSRGINNLGLNQIQNRFKKKPYCSNCNRYGHSYKDCNRPTASYGLIVFKQEGDDIFFLMVQRKDSMEYVECVRGRYIRVENGEDVNQSILAEMIPRIRVLLNHITPLERLRLAAVYTDTHKTPQEFLNWFDSSESEIVRHFTMLWNDLWVNHENKYFKKDFRDSLKKFMALVKGVHINGQLVNLQTLLNETESYWDEPDWGFPKGRRNMHETDLECAEREFAEETNFNKYNYELVEVPSVSETFRGTNGLL